MSLVSSSDRLRRLASGRVGRVRAETVTRDEDLVRTELGRPPTPTRPSQRLRAVTALEPGARIGPYVVREVLGRGSMGRVLRAHDPLGRDVAIKLVLPEMCDEEGRARFRREGQAMAAVPPHQNVVTVHSTGEHGPAPYLVMDHVPGESLERVLRRGPLPVEDAARVAEQMARALEHVHRAGVLHRDIKPANVIIRAEDQAPVLTDFGMAALRGAERLTRTGDLLGTPLYMAPEQVTSTRIDRRSEVWALGAILFEMLAGRPPFEGQSLAEVSRAITNDPLPPLRRLRPQVDAELERIVSGCLRKHPTDRPADPGEVAAALAAWRAGRGAPCRERAVTRVWPLALLAGASLLLAGDAVWRCWRGHHGGAGPAALAGRVLGLLDPAPPAVSPALAAPSGPGVASGPAGDAAAPSLGPAPTPVPAPGPGPGPAPGPAPAPALDAPLRAAGAALERDDPLAARELLTPALERAGEGDAARLTALRLEVVARAGRWLPDPDRRLEGLRLLAVLSAWRPAPGSVEADAEAGLGDALVQVARRVEAKATTPDEHQVAVALLEALAASGLRPGVVGQLDRALDDLWLMTKQAELVPERRAAAQALYWRGLFALARLDAVPSTSALLSADVLQAPWRAGRELLGDWLLLAVKTRRREQAANARRALGELLQREAARELGPRLRACGLVLAAGSEERSAARRELLERAVALDPESPWARRELGELLLRAAPGHELGAAGGGGAAAARAREEAERALQGYLERHADRASTAWELVNFQLLALEAAAALGDVGRVEALRAEVLARGEVDAERARWVEERLAEARRRVGPGNDQPTAREELR